MEPKRKARRAILLLSLLLALGLTVPLFTGCSVEDALEIATYVVENLPEEGAAPEGSTALAESAPEASAEPEDAEPPEAAAPEFTEPEAEAPETAAPEFTAPEAEEAPAATEAPAPAPAVEYGYDYSDPYDVADYIHLYGELPPNFITKNEAKEWGWISSEGNLWDVAPGMSIGGDKFGNYEKQLPEAKGRKWFECDVNYTGGYRGAERILYSNDGLIYYTDDHYESFTPIYE